MSSTRVKGSHDHRIRIMKEVEPEIKAITTKEEAAKVVQDNYRKISQMEQCRGMNWIKKYRLDEYLKRYEVAAQLAMRWFIFPEIVWGYAYRLQLLGFYSSGYRLEDVVEAVRGLFEKEMMGG